MTCFIANGHPPVVVKRVVDASGDENAGQPLGPKTVEESARVRVDPGDIKCELDVHHGSRGESIARLAGRNGVRGLRCLNLGCNVVVVGHNCTQLHKRI